MEGGPLVTLRRFQAGPHLERGTCVRTNTAHKGPAAGPTMAPAGDNPAVHHRATGSGMCLGAQRGAVLHSAGTPGPRPCENGRAGTAGV